MNRLGSLLPHSTSAREKGSMPAAPARGPHRAVAYDILWRSGQTQEGQDPGQATGSDELKMDFSLFIDASADNVIPEPVLPGSPVGEWCPATIVGHSLHLHFDMDDVLLVGIPQVLIETITDRGYALIIEIGANLRPERAYYAALALGAAYQKSLHRPRQVE